MHRLQITSHRASNFTGLLTGILGIRFVQNSGSLGTFGIPNQVLRVSTLEKRMETVINRPRFELG
jgi:hypothetical protein